jgi:hypothetical protein
MRHAKQLGDRRAGLGVAQAQQLGDALLGPRRDVSHVSRETSASAEAAIGALVITAG